MLILGDSWMGWYAQRKLGMVNICSSKCVIKGYHSGSESSLNVTDRFLETATLRETMYNEINLL